MDQITESTLTMLKAAMDARIPTMLVGSPGTAKTATIRSLASDMPDYEVITLVGSRMDSTDIAGLPHAEVMGRDENGDEIHGTANLSPWWQVRVLTHKKIILFLDEFSNTSPSVRASLLTLLQDREFANGHKFPQETIVIGAMNASAEAADGYELDLPTKNRIFFISWNPTLDSWIEGMNTAWGKEVPKEEMIWKKRITRFISENPTWIHRTPAETPTSEAHGVDPNNVNDKEVLASAWPSRRSWDNLSKILAHTPDNIYVIDTIAQGTVGYSASASFREWLNANEDVAYKLEEVLNDPKSVAWTEITPNDANNLLRNLMANITEDNSLQCINVFGAIADAEVQAIAGPFIQDFIRAAVSNDFKASIKKRNMDLLRDLVGRYSNISQKR